MTQLTLHWYLPTYGDSRQIMAGGHSSGARSSFERPCDLDYLTQLVRAAEHNGFESVLTPTGLWCEDAWLSTAALIGATSRLKFLVALRPGLVSPTVIAQQATTFQKLSQGRLLLNVVVGGEDSEQLAYGDRSTKEERYRRGDEALEILDRLWHEEGPVTFRGDYLEVEKARLKDRPTPSPPIFFGGSSPVAIEVAARRANVYLTWGEPPQDAAEKISRVAAAAAEQHRELDYGVRLHVIARPTAEEAWAQAQRLLEGIDPADVARVQASQVRSQSEGQRRMTQLHGAGAAYRAGIDARELQIAPNLWTGVGLVREGAGTALVGSYAEVAERLAEYQDAGFDHVILSGYPHLEETFHVGEGVVPALQQLGRSVANHPEPAVVA